MSQISTREKAVISFLFEGKSCVFEGLELLEVDNYVVTVEPGLARVFEAIYWNNCDVTLSLKRPCHGYARIDAVILKKYEEGQRIGISVVSGVELKEKPQKPAIAQDSEFLLGYIRIDVDGTTEEILS